MQSISDVAATAAGVDTGLRSSYTPYLASERARRRRATKSHARVARRASIPPDAQLSPPVFDEVIYILSDARRACWTDNPSSSEQLRAKFGIYIYISVAVWQMLTLFRARPNGVGH